MLIDTHAHVNFSAFKDDSSEVIRRSLDNNTWMINVGSQYSTSKRAIELAGKHESGVWAAIGLHPIHVLDEKFGYEKYKDLASCLIGDPPKRRVVAIGETGLDYKAEYISFKEKQKEIFLQQLDLAKELKLPIVIHCRLAHDDLIEILDSRFQIQDSKPRGAIHCFTGTWEQAQKYMKMGFYLGFNGIIFKIDLDKVIKRIPLDKILLETDCPYLTPPISVNQRIDQRSSASINRNEPLYVKHVAERIANLKNLSYEEIANITTKNAEDLFRI